MTFIRLNGVNLRTEHMPSGRCMRFVEAIARRGCYPGDDAMCSSLEWLQLLLFKHIVPKVVFR